MKIMSSYKIKILGFSKIFTDTVKIYRNACTFFLDVCSKEWDLISQHKTTKEKQRCVETLMLKTRSNPDPKYDFDQYFYKMPAYFRRAAISTAVGAYSSYDSNLRNWLANPEGKQPTLSLERNLMPVFYKGNMFVYDDSDQARIKVFHKNDWVWLTIKLRRQDVKYINKYCRDRKRCSPSLMKSGKRWHLVFPYEDYVTLSKTDISDQLVCGVDLGLNHDAVCSIMRSDGTVIAKRFINFPIEKDHLNKTLNRVRKAQQSGAKHLKNKWSHVNHINRELSIKTAKAIVDLAREHHCDVIVFEYLDFKGKIRGSKRMRLYVWRKREIQKRVMGMAHRSKIHISRVNARNTSRLAYDGSGYVKRGTYVQNNKIINNYSICIFPNGMVYNCDLNASYNIASRYFIRELLKSKTVTSRLPVDVDLRYGTGTTRTLSDLINLNADLCDLIA